VDPAPRPIRRRLLGVLFAGSGLARTGFIAAVTVTSLVAEDVLGSATLAGLPSAAAIVGVAVGTAPIAALMARRGRRPGISAGMIVAAGGALLAASAIGVRSFPLYVLGMFVFGFGNAGDRLSRYAAADISPPEQRSFSISLVVWAGTIGSVVGPLLLKPVESAAEAFGLEGLAGPPLLAAVVVTVGAVLAWFGLRPDPLQFVADADEREDRSFAAARPLLKSPTVRYAIVALLIGQVVMVLIMTMTPIHIRRAGEDLGIVGLVIGAHTFGMFALSPLTGLLADRIGRFPVMVMGQGVLVVSALMAAAAGGADRTLLVVSLFLLGFGWNLGFVAGSAYLTEGAPAHLRVPLQGLADAVVWSSGATASLSSGFLLETSGYSVLSLVGAALVAVPVVLMVRYGTRRLRAAPGVAF
jgi:MFS family permease